MEREASALKQASEADRIEVDVDAGHTPGTSSARDVRDARGVVIAVAAALLAEGGASAVTTRAVAHAAGMQVPALYRLFGDKDGLMDAVAEHVMAAWVSDERTVAAVEAAVEAADEAADEDPLADLVAHWHSHVEFGLANPDLYALLNTSGRVDRSPATTAADAVLSRRIHRLAAAGFLAVDEQRATGLMRAAGVGTVTTLLTSPAGRADEGLSDAVLDAVLDAMLVPGARPGRTGHRSDQAGVSDAPAVDRLTPLTASVALLAHLPELPALTDAERALMAEQLTRAITASPHT